VWHCRQATCTCRPSSGKPVVLWSNRIADADTFHDSVLWQASHEIDKAP
jgi:hypothetical protein